MNMKKIIPICIAGILLCTTFGAAAFNTEEQQNDSGKGSPLVFVYGTFGNNSWYISEVHVSFQWNPSDVAEIWYRLNIGQEYVKYTGQFTVTGDGSHIIPWYWIDKNNTIHDELPIEFGIDTTQPSIELAKQKLSKTEYKFTATASDATSGILKVEFYLDEVLVKIVTAAPYEYTWTGDEKQDVQAFAYDYAGHMKESNILGTPCSFVPSLYLFIRLLMQRVFQFI
jgi:hypothetical protein